jgi:hypothetical protein
VPEGDAHRELVRLLSRRIAGDAPGAWASFIDGIHFDARAGIPPLLGDHRPDVYAVERLSRRTIIGEAKTADDIDNGHTRRQLAAYFEHLAQGSAGEVWMAVPMMSGGAAHRVCRAARASVGADQIPFVITGWLFGPKPVVETWHG